MPPHDPYARGIVMKRKRRARPATSVDAYLSSVPANARTTLEKIRGYVRAAAPKAAETISYGMPVFKQDGLLVGFAAFKDHCSFFPMSASLMEAYKRELKAYDTSKGTIRFPTDKPLPAALVKKFVKARLKENEEKLRARRNRARKK